MTNFPVYTELTNVKVRVWHDHQGEPYMLTIQGEDFGEAYPLDKEFDRSMCKKQILLQLKTLEEAAK